jgi:predicted nuclease of predicted toxin-antitoxin system
MKIYADENIECSIIEGLRRRKIEVFSAKELGYSGKPDEFHIKKASEIKAVILTHDIDFLRMASSPEINHNGIIFSHSKDISIGQCIRGVELITNILTDKDMENHIEFL